MKRVPSPGNSALRRSGAAASLSSAKGERPGKLLRGGSAKNTGGKTRPPALRAMPDGLALVLHYFVRSPGCACDSSVFQAGGVRISHGVWPRGITEERGNGGCSPCYNR